MPQAEIISITTRRNALRLGAAATVTGLLAPVAAIAFAPTGPDAALLDLCRIFDGDTRELMRNDVLTVEECAGDPTLSLDDDALVSILDRWFDTLYAITALAATTPAGFRAKGAALGHALMQRVAVETKVSFQDQAEDYELLAMSLVRDLAAVPG